MTRQNKKKAGIIISLCAVLAAGQTVLAAGSGSGSNAPSVLYVGGAAAVMDHYFGQDTEEKTSASAGTSAAASSETKAQQEKTAFVRTSAQVPVAGVADLYETSAAAETIPETSSAPETSVVETSSFAAETTSAAEEQTEALTESPAESQTEGNAVASVPEVTVALPEKTAEELDWEARGAATAGYENFGIPNVDNYLNVRRSASSDAVIVGKMLRDSGCEILSKVEKDDGIWYEIQSGDVYGYVSADYMLTGQEAEDYGREVAHRRAVISTDTLNVRTEPSEDATIWTQANGNERYDVLQQLDGWIEIELDTDTGYVKSDYVEVRYALSHAIPYTQEEIEAQEKQSLRSQIVDYALQFVGNPYVWGGESLTNGVDCSGFTMKVYEKFGVYLSHYTGTQINEGRSISESELKKGDLIFYAKDGTVNHVAMYIGNGCVVHAKSTKAGITITDYNYRTPVRFVRYLDD